MIKEWLITKEQLTEGWDNSMIMEFIVYGANRWILLVFYSFIGIYFRRWQYDDCIITKGWILGNKRMNESGMQE